jgi:acetyl-CoA carboxylase biotin carboxyl carrier protein
MDHRELRRLVQLMNENDLVELEIEQEGMRVALRKAGASAPASAVLPAASAAAGSKAHGASPADEDAENDAAPPPGTKEIRSPMVGTFYRRSNPEADPYVDVGSRIEPETVVCIVEAMKVNNEIKAEISGEVVEVLAEDGQPVEFDQPLFRVKVG